MRAVPTYGPDDLRVEERSVASMFSARRLDPASIVSHTIALADAVEAYRMFDAREATMVALQP